jgi:hypothetical protein
MIGLATWSKSLGRERTKLGEWMDENGVSQADLHEWSSVSRPTITSLCGKKSYKPSSLTKRTIIGALLLRGYNLKEEDFWTTR